MRRIEPFEVGERGKDFGKLGQTVLVDDCTGRDKALRTERSGRTQAVEVVLAAKVLELGKTAAGEHERP